jgi:hypothetical protein
MLRINQFCAIQFHIKRANLLAAEQFANADVVPRALQMLLGNKIKLNQLSME